MTVYLVLVFFSYDDSWVDTVHATNDGAVARKQVLEEKYDSEHTVEVQPFQVEGVA